MKSLSPVWLFATPWTVAYQAPPSMEYSRQEYWSGFLMLMALLISGVWRRQVLRTCVLMADGASTPDSRAVVLWRPQPFTSWWNMTSGSSEFIDLDESMLWNGSWASLMVQQLRIFLCNVRDNGSIPGMGRSQCHGAPRPMCHNYWAWAMAPRSQNYWTHVQWLLKSVHSTACALQQEKPPQ